MFIVWRGSGITVLIFTLLSGWIVSNWFDDTRLGNYPFVGWTLLWSGIVLTIQGALVWGGGTPDPDTGEVPFRRGHDFFWIPVLFWGLGFIGLSIWLVNKEPDPRFGGNATSPTPTEVYSDNEERMVNIYNPYADSVDVLVSDLKTKQEVIEATIPPYSTRYKSFACKPYYVQLNGDDYKSKMRVQKAETHYSYEYDQVWYVLDGEADMILLDVTSVCDSTSTREDIEAVNWKSKVKERYNGKQMIAPYVKATSTMKPVIYGVGDVLPMNHTKRERIFALVPVDDRDKLDEEYLDNWVIGICFDE